MNNQDSYFKTNISNMVQDVLSSNKLTKFSVFLTEQEKITATKILNDYKFNNYLFFGGSNDCDREMLGVFAEYLEPDMEEFPICGIKILLTDKNIETISHRDYLGALMALQIKRDVIGDIFCFDNYGVVFVKEPIKEFILSNLDKIGKTRVKLSIINGLELENTRKFIELKGTVSSLRMDCVVAFLISKSRNNASEIIKAGLVTVNSIVLTNVSKSLKSGDIITIRGKGKFILGDDIKLTKKERLFITVNQFV